MASSIYDFSMTTIKGESQSLNDYAGEVILIVNTASKCGLTPQFKALEDIYKTYKDKGFSILGFPCNQFAHQDPADNDEIASFCEMNYGVTFPMYAKIDVNGDDASPLYQHLKEQAPGLLGSKGIKWNFTKFLVNKHGKVVQRFGPKDKPESIIGDIEKLLAE